MDYTPPYAFCSPFVQAEWDSGVVTIRKGKREEVRDFNILESWIVVGGEVTAC